VGVISVVRGLKNYELSNHLGNVLSVISDRKKPICNQGSFSYFEADIISATDYSPFGAPLAGRTFSSNSYRFGFNGMEKDNEVKGTGNSLDFGARIYDPRLGRFLSLDPCARKFPGESNYIFAGNSPIVFIDVDGKFKFSESTLALLKEKYPTTYKYLYENAKSGASGNILEIANSRRVVEAMIINMPNGNPNRDKMNEQVDYSIDIFLLTAQVIKDAYTPGGGQEILVKSNPGGVSNPLNTFGYNWAEDGTTYSSPIELNETILQAIEDAETPEAKQEALLNMVSVLTNEYLEDFGNDNHYILNKNGETTSTVGAKQAAKDIWGCFYIPQPDNDCAKKSIETRSSGGSAPDPSVIPVVPQ